MRMLAWWEFQVFAQIAGFKDGTVRQWRHRRKIPPAARSTMNYFIGGPFEIIDLAPPPKSCGMTLAEQCARFIK